MGLLITRVSARFMAFKNFMLMNQPAFIFPIALYIAP